MKSSVKGSQSAKDPQDSGEGMSGASWTPGPWRISGFEVSANGTSRVIMAADEFSVARVSERSREENIPNANLIAAAPQLYEALVSFMEIWGSDDARSLSKRAQAKRAKLWEKADAAIAKAEGK
jgi:hypothetical protein